MKVSEQIAKHFSELHYGGNWTSVNLKETLTGIDWKAASTRIDNFNTIAALVYHINYYVRAQLKVLQGEPLDSKDKYSFDHPPITSQDDWERLLQRCWLDADSYAALVAALPDEVLEQPFADARYGSWFRNLTGLIEHTHYHLGQIVLLKKMIAQKEVIANAGGDRKKASES